ncbi:MAG: sigma-54-dependent Fis family transcriptional regulator [Moorellaceae bacterium]
MLGEFYGIHQVVWREWNRFIKASKCSEETVRAEIRNSWRRCLDIGVDPYDGKGRQLLEGEALKEAREKQEELLRAARPVMQELWRLNGDAGFLVVLVGQDGYILETLGSYRETLDMAKKINFIPGACWREDAVGTNGIGTALALGQALHVTGAEHFCSGHHYWTCAGSPIFGPEGQVVGVIDLSGPWKQENRHMLSTVVVAAMAIENGLRHHKAQQKAVSQQYIAQYLLENAPQAILVVDKNGKLMQANRLCEKVLGWETQDLIGRPVGEIFRDPREILSVIGTRLGLKNKEAVIQSRWGPLTCKITLSPVSGDRNETVGMLIALEEPERRRVCTSTLNFGGLLGQSPRFLESVRLAAIAARSPSHVLLVGETGTGKEMFARAIHQASGRRGPFVALNCGAIPRELIGSELFGYVGGAFTGARPEGRPGKFEQAQGGTLFLDEISEMSPEMQVYLLRVLEDKHVVRLGGHKEIPVDVRVIAATNRDLGRLVQEGRFREDLYFRLRVLTITICPLRERQEDIPLLFEHFVRESCLKLNKDIKRIDPAIWPFLKEYKWPGNVRELRNCAEWSVNLAEGDVVGAKHLPFYILSALKSSCATGESPVWRSLDEIEKNEIERLLDYYRGNVTKVAAALGIARNTLYRKLYKYGLRG